ncbi:DUF4349 domain-containing protein [Streptacidiphilus jiangxiensis]|uniref:DUF4349 domain-containing protein n=1 Tax=Streptacidiphilus jiangxiensis TaxID=235985 RepID=A0A1H7L1C7_STRJI|nr:DUF4349 domain-containing protein [Streptacidiphilus jiangxiensis]SEK92185.1 protein of unknown function [Streptacidiphilus jiangxiensis]
MRSRDHRRRLGASLAAGFLVVGLALTGCSEAGSSNSSAAGAAPVHAPGAAAGGAAASAGGAAGSAGAASTAPSPGSSGAAAAASNRSVIYSGQIQLRCAHVDAAVKQAQTLVQSVGGYLDSEQVGDAGTLSWTVGDTTAASTLPIPSNAAGEGAIMVLRIPSASYDTVFGQLGSLGTVLAQQRSSQDVTSQVVDLDARVASEKASIDRLTTLMKQAGSLSDMITLEQAVTSRESDLNSLESQVAALRGQVALSTVTVELFQTATPPPPAKPKTDGAWSAAGHALASGWHALYMVGRGLLIAVSASFPFLALAALIAYGAYRFTRRRKPEADEE